MERPLASHLSVSPKRTSHEYQCVALLMEGVTVLASSWRCIVWGVQLSNLKPK
jgi:hypothetical protein